MRGITGNRTAVNLCLASTSPTANSHHLHTSLPPIPPTPATHPSAALHLCSTRPRLKQARR